MAFSSFAPIRRFNISSRPTFVSKDHLRFVVLLLGVLVLCFDKTTTNLNGIQFVRADPPIQYFLTAYLCIKGPLEICRASPGRTRVVLRQNHDKSQWHSVRSRRSADSIFPHGLPLYQRTT